MSKQETQILKGVAILMMVWLHLFNKDDVSALGNLIVVDGRPLVAWIARACNPVSMFVALGGYGLYFTSGALACKYDVVAKAKTWATRLETRRGGQVLPWVSLLLLFVVRCLVPHASWGGIFALLFLLNILLLKRHNKIDQALIFLGNHSMNIWMIHTWFCTYIFHPQLWSLHFPLLIYAALLVVSVLCSMVINQISKLPMI